MRSIVDGEIMSPQCGKDDAMASMPLIEYPATSQQAVSLIGWGGAMMIGAGLWATLGFLIL
ncbi:MAG: hypothetical protein ACKVOP_01005 [Sphingomonadaceae bacterium]